jgi:ubiquinol-cytochrome c reductase cytochrome b subunit
MQGHSHYVPKTGIGKWFDVRLPLPRLVYDSFVAYPVPKNLNYFWTFGGILSVMLVCQIITGVVLAMHYTAHVDMAFNSVEKIMRDVNYGWMLRYLHATGASMFFIAVYIHMFRGLYYGSYKAPREILWILGVIIYLLMMATAFMGYVLPWGQMSLWGAVVITNLFSAIPVVGPTVVEFLWGGYSVDNPTLNRFFSLHYLLPFMIAGVVVLHVWALHVTGQNNPTGVEVKDIKKDTVPFTPHATIKDAFGLVVFFILFMFFVFFQPNYLGHAVNYVPADPLVTPAHIVPEWYFLPFYAILRAITFDINLVIVVIPSKLGGVLAMFAAIAVLAFLPWLDTSKVKSTAYRPLHKQFFWAFVVVCVMLGWLGSKPAEYPYTVLSLIFTGLYFAYFLLVLPLLGLFETPKPLPASIADAVLEQEKKKGGAPVTVGATAAPQTKG